MRLHETAAYRDVFPKANDFANVLLGKFTEEEAAELRHIEKHLSRLEALISFTKGSVCALRSVELGRGIDFDLPFMPDKHITAALNLGANFIVHRQTPCPTLMRENLETIGAALTAGFVAAKRELAEAQNKREADDFTPKTLGDIINAIVADAEKTMKKLAPDTLKSSPKRFHAHTKSPEELLAELEEESEELAFPTRRMNLSQAAANFANSHETSRKLHRQSSTITPAMNNPYGKNLLTSRR